MEETPYWTDIHGKVWRPEDMEPSYRQNVIAFMERNAETFYAKEEIWKEGATGCYDSEDFQAAYALANRPEIIAIEIGLNRQVMGAEAYHDEAVAFVREMPIYRRLVELEV